MAVQRYLARRPEVAGVGRPNAGRVRVSLIVLVSVSAAVLAAPTSAGTTPGSTVALGTIKGPGGPPDPGPIG
jgi:hypothetical protein